MVQFKGCGYFGYGRLTKLNDFKTFVMFPAPPPTGLLSAQCFYLLGLIDDDMSLTIAIEFDHRRDRVTANLAINDRILMPTILEVKL